MPDFNLEFVEGAATMNPDLKFFNMSLMKTPVDPVAEIATNPSIQLAVYSSDDDWPDVNESFEVYPPPSIEKMADNQCARENDRAKTNPEYITIDEGFFEHLLNCLANQKYQKVPSEHSSDREKETQTAIDEAWNEGMKILNKRDQFKNIRIIKS